MNNQTEEQQIIAASVEKIRKYEAGDTSLEDEILSIIDEIWEFSKITNKVIRLYKKGIRDYKNSTKLLNIENIRVSELYKNIDEYLDYYKECAKKIKRYIKIGFKTGDFPDLEAAYLLIFSLADFQDNIGDSLDEISSIENYQRGIFSSVTNPNLKESCLERHERVRKLVEIISPKKETDEEA